MNERLTRPPAEYEVRDSDRGEGWRAIYQVVTRDGIPHRSLFALLAPGDLAALADALAPYRDTAAKAGEDQT